MPVRGGDHERALVKTIGTKDFHKSIDWPVCVEQVVTIVDDRAVAGAGDPEVVPAIGLEEIRKVSQKGFGVFEGHPRSRLVPAGLMAIAARRDQHIEKPQRFRQALDQFDHQVHMAAARPDAQPFLTIGESLPLKNVVIPVRFPLFRSRAKLHTYLRLSRPGAALSLHGSAARRQYPMVVPPTVSACSA